MTNQDSFLDKIGSKLAVVGRDGSFIPVSSPALSDAFQNTTGNATSSHLVKPLKQRNLPIMARRFNALKASSKFDAQRVSVALTASNVGITASQSGTMNRDSSSSLWSLAKIKSNPSSSVIKQEERSDRPGGEKEQGSHNKIQDTPSSAPMPSKEHDQGNSTRISAPSNSSSLSHNTRIKDVATLKQKEIQLQKVCLETAIPQEPIAEESISTIERNCEEKIKISGEEDQCDSAKNQFNSGKESIILTFKPSKDENLCQPQDGDQAGNPPKLLKGDNPSYPDKKEENDNLIISADQINDEHKKMNSMINRPALVSDEEIIPKEKIIKEDSTPTLAPTKENSVHTSKSTVLPPTSSSVLFVEAPISTHGSTPITYSYTLCAKESTQLEKHMLQKIREWNLWEVAMLRELTRMVEPAYAADKLHEAAAQGSLGLKSRHEDDKDELSYHKDDRSTSRDGIRSRHGRNLNHSTKCSLKLSDYDLTSSKHGFVYLKMSEASHNGSMYSSNHTIGSNSHDTQRKYQGNTSGNRGAKPNELNQTINRPTASSNVFPPPLPHSQNLFGKHDPYSYPPAGNQHALIGTKIGEPSTLSHVSLNELGRGNTASSPVISFKSGKKGLARLATPVNVTPWGSNEKMSRAEMIASRNSFKPKRRVISIQRQQSAKRDADLQKPLEKDMNSSISPEVDDRDSVGNTSELHPAEYAMEASLQIATEPMTSDQKENPSCDSPNDGLFDTDAYDLEIPQAWDSSLEHDMNLFPPHPESHIALTYANAADVASPAIRHEVAKSSQEAIQVQSVSKPALAVTTEWKLGSLGPDKENEEYQAKVEKRNRQKEYSEKIRQHVKTKRQDRSAENASVASIDQSQVEKDVDDQEEFIAAHSNQSSPQTHRPSLRRSSSGVKLPQLYGKPQSDPNLEKKARMQKAKAYAASIKKPSVRTLSTKADTIGASHSSSSDDQKKLPPINSAPSSSGTTRSSIQQRHSDVGNIDSDIRELEEVHLRGLTELESIKKDLKLE